MSQTVNLILANLLTRVLGSQSVNALGLAPSSTAAADPALASAGTGPNRLTQFLVADFLAKLFDVGSGGGIVQLPQALDSLVRASNRVCRFRLPGESTPFGTGFLIGPACVLTAAHLFFDLDTGALIDPNRAREVRLEFPTMHIGSIAMEGRIVEAGLFNFAEHWAVDPHVDNGHAHRPVDVLDYAIVRLDQDVGENVIGFGETRGWFELPLLEDAPVLKRGIPLQVLQFIDSDALRTASGVVTELSVDRTRVFYTASTLQAASGGPILDTRSRLAGIHLGGPDAPGPGAANDGLPIRRVIESVDEQGLRADILEDVER